MSKVGYFFCYGIALFILSFSLNSFGLVLPTASKKVDLYVGLFGNTSNPAQRPGCYNLKNNVFTGKQLIEYSYTAMDCADSVAKATPGTPGSLLNTPDSFNGDFMKNVLARAGAIQLGLNFTFSS